MVVGTTITYLGLRSFRTKRQSIIYMSNSYLENRRNISYFSSVRLHLRKENIGEHKFAKSSCWPRLGWFRPPPGLRPVRASRRPAPVLDRRQRPPAWRLHPVVERVPRDGLVVPVVALRGDVGVNAIRGPSERRETGGGACRWGLASFESQANVGVNSIRAPIGRRETGAGARRWGLACFESQTNLGVNSIRPPNGRRETGGGARRWGFVCFESQTMKTTD